MKKNTKRIFWLIILGLFVSACIVIYQLYSVFFLSNVKLNNEHTIIHIPTGSDFDDVCEILKKSGGLQSVEKFKLTAKHKNYIHNIKPGRYKIQNHMSNNALVNMLRAGKQEPVQLTFNNVRTIDDLAVKVSKQLEFSKDSLLRYLKNDSIAQMYGFSVEEFPVMFIPNTYELFWNTSPEDFVKRMHKEYNRFWNEERINKAASIPLTPTEVTILASIVVSETTKRDEMSRVAGVYINRLKRGMKLEADPTVKFAIGDFTIQRILYKHLEYDSPYNTYLYPGLPPGPIYLPDAFAIDAVLNYEKHNFLFMCAKDDFSGYHAFATNHAEHQRNAQKYHAALNKAKIR